MIQFCRSKVMIHCELLWNKSNKLWVTENFPYITTAINFFVPILQIVDYLFVLSCFVSKITLSPHYVRIRKKEKSKIQMMTWKQLKQGCMQTLDNNFEMLKKAERRSTSKHPTTSCSLFQKLICFIAALHKRNSFAFFLSFATIT